MPSSAVKARSNSFRTDFANGLVVLPIRIGKRDDRRTQQRDEVILTARNLFRAFSRRQLRQIRMCFTVRAEFDPLARPSGESAPRS